MEIGSLVWPRSSSWLYTMIARLSIRSHLKKVFWANLCVGPSFQLLEILEYACGLKLSPALTLIQNPIFEMVSSNDAVFFFRMPYKYLAIGLFFPR